MQTATSGGEQQSADGGERSAYQAVPLYERERAAHGATYDASACAFRELFTSSSHNRSLSPSGNEKKKSSGVCRSLGNKGEKESERDREKKDNQDRRKTDLLRKLMI